MAQQLPKEEKKIDFTSFPRGAINIKGLPVSRNTRLPSIRSPRDLTLGAPPKRTFMPNIPVRREKKSVLPENASNVKQENKTVDRKESPQIRERGRGKGRGKSQIIQSQGSIFSEGIAADPLLRKEKVKDDYQKSHYPSSSKGIFVKKEKEDNDIGGIDKRMDLLFRDDFIDDKDHDDFENEFKPVIFPIEMEIQAKKGSTESAIEFNADVAKDMDFDINRIAKLIKKEKGIEHEEKTSVPTEVTSNKIANLLNGDGDSSKLLLIQFPDIVNLDQKIDDSPESSQKRSSNAHSDNQNFGSTSFKSLPEGYIGKLQILKSGKARLLMGSFEFNLHSLKPLQTKHEVVSINTDSNVGNLTVLGCLQHKLTFIPEEDCLLGVS